VPEARIAVTADLSLIAETVAAALSSRGLEATVVPWQRTSVAGPIRRAPPDLTLLICDLGAPGRTGEARQRGRGGAWMVMTEERPGPEWGAMLEAGACTVISSTISIDDLVALLRAVLRGESPMSDLERQQLVHHWRTVETERARIRRRVDTLTPRERTVLAMLHEGTTVRTIADRFGVSEATVRSQVKAVLRKLAVASQLAAVAAVDELEDHDGTDR
jgi:RNA polymerase sigma factor (sigma-70 family)